MLRNFDTCIGYIVRSSVRGLIKALVLFKKLGCCPFVVDL